MAKRGRTSAKVLTFPRVPPIRKRSEAHTPKTRKPPKHKTNWSRLDDLYKD